MKDYDLNLKKSLLFSVNKLNKNIKGADEDPAKYVI